MERRAKLLGLDAATKLQQEVTVTTDDQSGYDLQKLDMDEMHLYGYLLEKMHNPNSPDRVERPKLREEVRAKLDTRRDWHPASDFQEAGRAVHRSRHRERSVRPARTTRPIRRRTNRDYELHRPQAEHRRPSRHRGNGTRQAFHHLD